MTCPDGKKGLDKKGAVTLKNLTMRLHHIKMKVYRCPFCNQWHLASIGGHKPFRHNIRRKYA